MTEITRPRIYEIADELLRRMEPYGLRVTNEERRAMIVSALYDFMHEVMADSRGCVADNLEVTRLSVEKAIDEFRSSGDTDHLFSSYASLFFAYQALHDRVLGLEASTDLMSEELYDAHRRRGRK